MPSAIRFGVDHLLDQQRSTLRNLRVGLVTNDTAVTAYLPYPMMPSRLALQRADVNLTKLFAPEHGLGAAAADGAEIANERDALTGLPVYSLYGTTYRPTAEMLSEIDLLLFDIPDIGARFYTYIWTLSYLLEACSVQQLPLWVLDRPNPLGGDLGLAEGPMLDEAHISTFVGRWAIPIRHALTAGELAQFWNAERNFHVDLTVVTALDWHRQMDWSATGLSFVPTSPAMPSAETIYPYLATCFFEGTNLSEGRGTAIPFRAVGAPWLDANGVVAQFNALQLPGVVARATQFTPATNKYANELCHGIMLHVLDPLCYHPVATGLHLLWLIMDQQPEKFAWLSYPTADNAQGISHFDRLVGTTAVRSAIGKLATHDVTAQIAQWTEVAPWADTVQPYLLYP
ncbi:MAG: DUF1343 domain-containing protein [Caldilineaceae bacterium]